MAGERLRIDVLGPLRVVDPAGLDVTPDGHLQRRLLALLVLRRGRVVPVDVAIEVLWPTKSPGDPPAALHNHVSRLRRVLPAGVVESSGDGYRLDPARVDLDADRLAAALADPAAASGDLDAVLARWHGPAYPELDGTDDGPVEAARLEELRTRARELVAERRLARGDTEGLVAELRALVDDEPLRERPCALLMTALAATGRQVEALRAYDDFRRRLGDELGIEPSPALTAQHAELLSGSATTVRPWAPATRLPVPVTSLVGRDDLVDDGVATVERHRLVTLVGTGGVGKTRVLLEIGNRLLAAKPERPVVLCELATATPATAIDAVAGVLGIDARPGVPLAERITDVLGTTEVVVLLDGCEHVLDPIAGLADRLVARCPNAKVVTSSRERLRVAGEQVCSVPTLLEHDATAAIDLFVERARAVVPGFTPDDDGGCIAEIVRRLDGLPLAIELAAARLHTHDLAEVVAGLDHRFALLSSGYRTSSRHGSLHAAVSWSFGLLDPHLQRVFAALSVFADSFDAVAAAAVCDAAPAATADALAQLTERSLVTRAPERRYVLLETLREFGAEALHATGIADEVHRRHAAHQVEWAEAADARAFDAGSRALAEIEAALPELRAAFDWLLANGEVELAGRLVVALRDFAFLRLRPDVMGWAERVVAADPDDAGRLAPSVWVNAAYSAWMAGDRTECAWRSTRAVEIAERRGLDSAADVFMMRGNVDLFDGRLDGAATWYGRAVDAAAATGDEPQQLFVAATRLLAHAYGNRPGTAEDAAALLADAGDTVTPYSAYLWYCAAEVEALLDVERARARYVRAEELAEATNASFVTGVASAARASIDARYGDPFAAAAGYRQVLDHWRRAGSWSTQWTVLRSIAALLARLGRERDAAVIEGAVRATGAGHRIFGADEIALNELRVQLRTALGDDEYDRAQREGARLDGDAAVEHALRVL